MKYRFVHQHPEHPVAKWAKLLYISRSGYYSWLEHKEERQKQEEIYEALVESQFKESQGTYGAERICGALRNLGYTASFQKVKSIMKKRHLHSIHPPRKQHAITNSRSARDEECPNLVKKMEITKAFQVITSDISYLKTTEGSQYICKIKDVASGTVLAQTISDRMKADLVMTTIKTMLNRWKIPKGCIFHSDRGSQYRAEEVRKLLNQHGLLQSFSGRGKPGDNAWSESFFSILKKEMIHGKPRKSKSELNQDLFIYTEGFYNTKRIQKRLGYLSPMEWLKQNQMSKLESVP